MRVKELRLATGQSQEAFADKCGFARSYMSRIERGGANPSLDAIEVLAAALGVEVQKLFECAQETAVPPTIEVPYAKDGTCFRPELASPTTGKFKVGEKQSPVWFDTFDEAIEYLKTMKTAKWWRPNANGHLGLVSAVRWGLLSDAPPYKQG